MSNESTIAGSSTKSAIMNAAVIESDHDESDLEVEGESSNAANQGASTSAGKKKKKKKSKASKILNKLKGNGENPDEVPQEVVDKVMEEIRTQGTLSPEELTAENIRQALQEMKILDVVKGKAGIGGLNPKDMGEHKVRVPRSVCSGHSTNRRYSFGQLSPYHNRVRDQDILLLIGLVIDWPTGEGPPEEDGYIEPSVPVEEVRQTPYGLPNGYEWSTLDIQDPEQVHHPINCVRIHLIGLMTSE